MDNYRRERDEELKPVARWFAGECEKQWEKRQEEGEKKRRIELMNRHKAVPDKGGFRPMKNYKLDVDHLNAIEEQTPDWLILDYVPMYRTRSQPLQVMADQEKQLSGRTQAGTSHFRPDTGICSA